MVELLAPVVGGVTSKSQKLFEVDHALAGAPSVLFDAVVIAPSSEGAAELLELAAAIDWIRDAFAHLKVIGFTPEAARRCSKRLESSSTPMKEW